ncbi:MAG: tetratricopeptide repeat protein [Pacificimonas sp.]|jgi:tetratricopeptide (TPR) repeat protein|nr:tetratricopeptide repeat protein [Pacificimonas sp.]
MPGTAMHSRQTAETEFLDKNNWEHEDTMKLISQIALGAALALGAGTATIMVAQPAAAQEAEEWKVDLSRDGRNAIAAANEAFEAQDYPTAEAALRGVIADPGNADDVFVANQVLLNIAIQTNNDPLLDEALLGMLNSGSGGLTPERELQFRSRLANTAVTNEDYPTALMHFNRIVELQPGEPATYYNVGVIHSRMNNEAAAYAAYDKALDAAAASGQPAEQDWYFNHFTKGLELGEEMREPLKRFYAAYPDGQTIRNLVLLYRDERNLDDTYLLNGWRLIEFADGMADGNDYLNYADIADRGRSIGEASAVLNRAIAAGILSADDPQVLSVKEAVGEPDPLEVLVELEPEVEAESDGTLAASLANDYTAIGEYAKAVTYYDRAMEQGGVDMRDLNIRKGIALTRLENYDAAIAAFEEADDPDDITLADFWIAYVEAIA